MVNLGQVIAQQCWEKLDLLFFLEFYLKTGQLEVQEGALCMNIQHCTCTNPTKRAHSLQSFTFCCFLNTILWECCSHPAFTTSSLWLQPFLGLTWFVLFWKRPSNIVVPPTLFWGVCVARVSPLQDLVTIWVAVALHLLIWEQEADICDQVMFECRMFYSHSCIKQS